MATTYTGADAWGAVLRVQAGLVPMLDRMLRREADLPLSWYDVLLELNAAPDRRLRMSDLGDRVVLSRTRISRLVDELAAAGLVTKESNPDDRRSSFASMTDAGRAQFRRAAPIYLRGIDELFTAHLSATEVRTIAPALARVHEAQTPNGAAR